MKVSWKDTAHVDEMDLVPLLERAAQYSGRLKSVWKQGGYDAPESSINLPFDTTLLEIRARAHELLAVSKLKYIVLVGIGGSSLGTEAVYQALLGYVGRVAPDTYPRCVFVDTLESEYLQEVIDVLDRTVTSVQEVALVVVSKSGTTIETIANAAIIFNALKARFARMASRSVVITDSGSPLAQWGEREGVRCLYIPPQVGGRFSVFSAAGLFPLALMSIDVRELRSGAASVFSSLVEGQDTSVHETAAVLSYYHARGLAVHDTFLFNPRLEMLGKWYRQLLGESIGKERSVATGFARVGFTPTVSIGTTDLHSVAQLYFAGPRNRVTTLVGVADDKNIVVPEHTFADVVPSLQGRPIRDITSAIYRGVRSSYQKQQLPFMEIVLDRISAFELGAFMQYKMLETMHLAHLLNVNAFDQPAVEYYKAQTRSILDS